MIIKPLTIQSATRWRPFEVSWVYASLLPIVFSPMARPQSYESLAKGGAYHGEEEEGDRRKRPVRVSAS